MSDTPAIQAAVEAAGVPLEAVVAASEAAIERAEERAEAAEQVAALVTEAAASRAISERVDDLEEEQEQWQGELNQLRSEVTAMAQTLSSVVTAELLQAAIADLRASLSIPQQPAKPTSETSETNQQPQAGETQNPSHAAGDGHASATANDGQGEQAQKPKRFHLT